MATPQLGDLLAEVVPKDAKINVRHVSTTPTRCEAIFSTPPGEDPETTFCESHFLVVTLNRNEDVGDEIAILGVEVYIYTTDRLTTLFVSKADSTGYLHLSKVAAATAPKTSLLRVLTTTFLSYLAHAYQRPGVRLVLSLFARAQGQYLFPGSADNKRKHILDDRGLIRWWCRAADPIVREHVAESQVQDKNASRLDEKVECLNSSATAYLLVPGCDQYETRSFFPATARSDSNNKDHPRWRVSYPVSQIRGHVQHAPPRCLVPRFPDDPKARFLIDLDDELPENAEHNNDSKSPTSGQWRSVKSLEQFWEMMSFRQECSAGRLVGFLWLVINPPGLLNSDKLDTNALETAGSKHEVTDSSSSKDKILSGIAPATTTAEAKFDDRSLSSPYNKDQPIASIPDSSRNPFYWPEAGRGEVILSEADYKNANDILLEQDFETEELAMAGTMAWVRKVAALADVLWWGVNITGKKEVLATAQSSSLPVQALDTGLIVRKRKKDAQDIEAGPGDNTTGSESNHTDGQASTEPGVNVLNASFIRKRKKAEDK